MIAVDDQRHQNFNSRTSCEVRPEDMGPYVTITGFQLTHLLRGATLSNSGMCT